MQRTSSNALYLTLKDSNGNVLAENEFIAPEERFLDVNRMVASGLLASSFGHEIINPNNSISLSASMLAEIWADIAPVINGLDTADGEARLGRFSRKELMTIVPELIEGISEAVKKVVATVNRSRMFVATPGNDNSMVAVNDVLLKTTLLLRQYTHKYTGNFSMSLADQLPPVWGNQQLLLQLCVNLLMNALQSLPDKRAAVAVETSLDHENGHVVITVRDEGVGMAEEVLARATEPFFSSRKNGAGAGLGLFIATAIITQHSGFLQFSSTPGEGTTVKALLPIAGQEKNSG